MEMILTQTAFARLSLHEVVVCLPLEMSLEPGNATGMQQQIWVEDRGARWKAR